MAKWSASKISSLSESDWKKYKKAAGIKDSPWFKKADAAISKEIKAYQSTRDKWRKAGKADKAGLKDAVDYHASLKRLSDGFKKFVSAKEFKSELAKELQSDIAKWQTQLDAKVKKVGANIRDNAEALKGRDASNLMDGLEKMGVM